MSRDSLAGIATGWATEVQFPAGSRGLFSTPQGPDRLCGPPSLLSNGYWGIFFVGLKQPGRECEHPSSANVEVKNSGTISSLRDTSSSRDN
jgi:hypothetical protein